MARSSSEGSVISYVLPVLWATSCFRILEGINPNQRQLSSVQFSSPGGETGAKSAVSDCMLLENVVKRTENKKALSPEDPLRILVRDVNSVLKEEGRLRWEECVEHVGFK